MRAFDWIRCGERGASRVLEWYEALLFRVGRGGQPVTEREEHELRSRWEAWIRDAEAPAPDVDFFYVKDRRRPRTGT